MGYLIDNWNTYPVLEFTELDEYSREFTMFFDYLKAWGKVKKNTSTEGVKEDTLIKVESSE